MKENNLIPSGRNVNINTREKIKKFNFLVQYTDVNSNIENKKVSMHIIIIYLNS